MLGVGPFITGLIIIQLLTTMFPSWKAMLHDDGEAGRMKLSQYSRLLGAPLAVIQAVGFIILLQSQNVLPQLDAFSFIVNVLVITAGSMLLMRNCELISEYGIGNGVSLIIFAGIVSSLPTAIIQNIQKISTTWYIGSTILYWCLGNSSCLCCWWSSMLQRPKISPRNLCKTG